VVQLILEADTHRFGFIQYLSVGVFLEYMPMSQESVKNDSRRKDIAL
jgi:hypothetical protein